MKNLKLYSLLVIIVIFAISCSEDITTNNTTNFFPMTQGSYWVSNNYSVDSNGTKTKTYMDSLVITDKNKDMDGQKATEFTDYNDSSKIAINQRYHYLEGSKLYLNSTYINRNLDSLKMPSLVSA